MTGVIFIKKRLLFVNGHLNVGGVERSLVDLLKYIDYDKYEVDLVLFEELGDYIDEIPESVNVKFYDMTSTYGSFINCILGNLKKGKWKDVFTRIVFTLEKIFGAKVKCLLKLLFKDLREYDCAIAYRTGFCTDFVAYVVNAKNKLTWWHHGSYDYDEEQTKKIEKVYEKFDYIVSVSKACKKMLLEHLNIQNDKIVVIPNIIDFKNIRMKSLEIIEDVSYDNVNINIVSIGRLYKAKGMINCVYVCKKLIDSGYKIKWLLIGDGDEYQNIQLAIKENGLQESVYLLGNKKNPYPYLKRADIYVHPSYMESMSITVIEALGLYKPVVVAKSLGPSEFIVNKENGLIVEPGINGLYEGVLMLLKNKKLCDQICINNEDLLIKYSPEVIINKVEVLIENNI